MSIKIGDKVWLPSYETLVNKYGLTIRNGRETLDLKPYWDSEGRMKSMCGDFHSIINVYDGKVTLAYPHTGTNFNFSLRIFEDFQKKTYTKGKKKVIHANNIVLKQLKHRYEFIDYNQLNTNQKSYGIIDSIYPSEVVYTTLNDGRRFISGRAGCTAISERVARDLAIPQLHISDLVGIYGYTKTSIKDILLAVKKKKFKMCVIGYGGTGTNFLHWLSKMAEWANITKIFDDLVISDNDYFDSVNLLRVPFILPQYEMLRKKPYYFKDYAHISREYYIMDKNINAGNAFRDHVHYGAPDLETRKMLDQEKIAFIAATHRDNACGLMLRPNLDTELMVETYGKIALTPFFLNHIRMTISFMEYLADETTTMEAMKGEEKTILEYDFVEANEGFVIHGGRIGGRTMYPVIADQMNTVDIEIGEE